VHIILELYIYYGSNFSSSSLIPRSFPTPVFDRWQYTSMEGEGLGNLIMCGDAID